MYFIIKKFLFVFCCVMRENGVFFFCSSVFLSSSLLSVCSFLKTSILFLQKKTVASLSHQKSLSLSFSLPLFLFERARALRE